MKSLRTKLLIIVVMLLSLNLSAENYCAGIRGNGELVVSHWPAMARIVENKGLPSKVAGGSSAAVTLFFLDALSRNKVVSFLEPKKNHELALLLKSIIPHIEYLMKVDLRFDVMMGIMGSVNEMENSGFFKTLGLALK